MPYEDFQIRVANSEAVKNITSVLLEVRTLVRTGADQNMEILKNQALMDFKQNQAAETFKGIDARQTAHEARISAVERKQERENSAEWQKTCEIERKTMIRDVQRLKWWQYSFMAVMIFLWSLVEIIPAWMGAMKK